MAIETIWRVVAGHHEIVDGHDIQEKYAECFLKDGVVAIGWDDIGNLSKLTEKDILKKIKKFKWGRDNPTYIKKTLLNFRDKMKIGDTVIAYKSPNTIVAVGKITSKYFYDDKDKLGDELGYPNKRKVDWKKMPRYFNRSFLPKEIRSRVSNPPTIVSFDYDIIKLESKLKTIPSGEMIKDFLVDVSEEQIKRYFMRNPNEIESGLEIIGEEYKTKEGPIDLLGKKEDKFIVIEIKKNASDSVIGQILGYMNAIKEEKKTNKVRGIILAESFDQRVKTAVKDLSNIELVQVKLKFQATKIKI